CQVSRYVNAGQAVWGLSLVAESEEFGQWASVVHLQQRCQVAPRGQYRSSDRHAQVHVCGSARIQRAPSTDVRDLAQRAADEVALAVDLLDEAFSLEYGEGASQCGRADLVPVGQGGLRREPFTGS